MIYDNANRPELLEDGDTVVFRVPESLIMSNPSVDMQDVVTILARSQSGFPHYGLGQDTDYRGNGHISCYYTVRRHAYLWFPSHYGEHDLILRLVSRDKYEFCSRYYGHDTSEHYGIFPEAPSMAELTLLVNGIFEILGIPGEKCPKCGSSDIKASKHLAGVNTHEGCCDYIKNTILRDL